MSRPTFAKRFDSKHRTNKFTRYELKFDGTPGTTPLPSNRNSPARAARAEAEEENDEPAPDSLINADDALRYWANVTKDDAGVLGGYPQVSRVDLQGSLTFITKLRRKSKDFPPTLGPFERVVDCGAGIGRVTKGFLSKIAHVVDVVEPVEELTDVITKGKEFDALRKEGQIGEIYNVGLEHWTPEEGAVYECIWNQWCLGQLNDQHLVEYFKRIKGSLAEGGWIVVKENMSTDPNGQDVFDPADSSVTRSDNKFRQLFAEAGLRMVATEVQKGMPLELYPVRTYALTPIPQEESDEEETRVEQMGKKRKARKS